MPESHHWHSFPFSQNINIILLKYVMHLYFLGQRLPFHLLVKCMMGGLCCLALSKYAQCQLPHTARNMCQMAEGKHQENTKITFNPITQNSYNTYKNSLYT